MLSAIKSSGYANTGGNGAGSASLQFQLAQCQRQLSDWVHCPSAKTPEGKAIIQKLTDKLSQIKQQIAAADKAQANNPPASPNGTAATNAATSTPASSFATGPGSLINIYAS